MSGNGDDYVKVAGKVRHVRPASVLFSPGETVGAAWIPRSCIHGADDLALTDRTGEINRAGNRGTPMTLRIRRWKAEETGMAGARDGHTEDLFAEGGSHDHR